jgi:hypothetical protein
MANPNTKIDEVWLHLPNVAEDLDVGSSPIIPVAQDTLGSTWCIIATVVFSHRLYVAPRKPGRPSCHRRCREPSFLPCARHAPSITEDPLDGAARSLDCKRVPLKGPCAGATSHLGHRYRTSAHAVTNYRLSGHHMSARYWRGQRHGSSFVRGAPLIGSYAASRHAPPLAGAPPLARTALLLRFLFQRSMLAE